MANTFSLGVARAIITPEVGGNLMGYSPDIVSYEIHDDLVADVYYFKDGETQVLFVSASVGVISESICKDLRSNIEKEYGSPCEHCLIHSTHTHSAPILLFSPGWGEPDFPYIENVLRPRLLGAVGEAIENAEPVTVAVATGESLVASNRREITLDNQVILGQRPWGPFDPKMTIMSFMNEKNRIVATLVHYTMHGTASGPNHEVTRDWSGIMVDTIEENIGGISSFINGAIGDVGPRMPAGTTKGGYVNGKFCAHARYAVQIGSVAAQDAMRIAKNMTGYKEAHVSVLPFNYEMPLVPRLPLETAKRELEKYAGNRVNIAAGKAGYYKRVVDSYEAGFVEKETLPKSGAVIKIGDIAIVCTQFELFSEIGMRIAGASKLPYTVVLSNVNGSGSYIPTEGEICRGGYEVEMFKTGFVQPYANNADFYIVTESLARIEEICK